MNEDFLIEDMFSPPLIIGQVTVAFTVSLSRSSIVELKSLKLYIVKFRNLGIFHEEATNKILKDFKAACKPKKIKVHGDFSPRGGIKTEVFCKS